MYMVKVAHILNVKQVKQIQTNVKVTWGFDILIKKSLPLYIPLLSIIENLNCNREKILVINQL